MTKTERDEARKESEMSAVAMIPVSASEVSRWKCGDDEWESLEEAPEHLRCSTLGNFLAFHRGSWKEIRGAYMSPDGPMLWLCKEESDE